MNKSEFDQLLDKWEQAAMARVVAEDAWRRREVRLPRGGMHVESGPTQKLSESQLAMWDYAQEEWIALERARIGEQAAQWRVEFLLKGDK